MAGVNGLELPVILSEGDLRPEALVYALRRACRIVGAADAQRMADALETGGGFDPDAFDDAYIHLCGEMPAGVWYGSHPGDPACIGLWADEDAE